MMNKNQAIFSIPALLIGTMCFASAWNPSNAPEKFNVDFHPATYTKKFTDLPLAGSVTNQHIPWSDSYWPKNRGGAAYQWKKYSTEDARQNLTPQEAQRMFLDYRLPSQKELSQMSQKDLDELSPTEKYDIFSGKFNYPLTKSYLNRGFFHKISNKFNRKMSNSKNNAYWEGYCNAWSAASLHYPEPKPVSRTVTVNGKQITLNFGSGDVKALMVASYAEHLGGNPQMGNFCNQKLTFPGTKMFNGKEVYTQYADTDGLMMSDYPAYIRNFQASVKRVGYDPDLGLSAADAADPNLADRLSGILNSDLNCQDTNAGAFHVLMANQLGLMKEGFVIDKTMDVEIWNQPVFKYVSTVVGPAALSATKAPQAISAVQVKTSLFYGDDTDYGWTYWNPTLTNLFGTDSSFLDEFYRYQRMLIKQGDQDKILSYPNNVIGVSHYTYNLELDAAGNVVGGEWLSFDRPDIAWLPHKFAFDGKFQNLNRLYEPIQVPADATPNFGDEE